MNQTTIQRLIAINREFYERTAADFDQTRGQPWPGWERLLAHLPGGGGPLRVLDVGCGNGRLGLFLAANRAQPGGRLIYHGIDSSPALLQRARESLAGLPGVSATLEMRDALLDAPPADVYDLVAIFGVLHHVPGFDFRRRWLQTLASRVAPGGLLAFAAWRFYEYERFQRRVVPWPPELAEQVERHDYLLDWRRGVQALRYCHYVDDAEHADLVRACDLPERESYRADGFTGAVNRYSILGQEPRR